MRWAVASAGCVSLLLASLAGAWTGLGKREAPAGHAEKPPGNLVYVTEWGRPGAGNGQFNGIGNLAIGPSGAVYVVDRRNYRVQVFAPDGRFLGRWGDSGQLDGEFDHPTGIATDASGVVYVADDGVNRRVQKFTAEGRFVAAWGSEGNGDGQFSHPSGIATSRSGNVYVSDDNAYRVQKFTADGAYVTQWGRQGDRDGQFQSPGDVATDAAGNVYVVDSSRALVEKFTSDGKFVTAWGKKPSGTGREGQFLNARGIAVGPGGTIYVADTGRIQKFTSDGKFLLQYPSPQDKVEFDPVDVAVDNAGNIYVTDGSGNGQRVLEFREGPPPGQPGRFFTVARISGTVLVRAKGTQKFVDLSGSTQLAPGSEVDTTHGRVGLTSVGGGTGTFSEGRFVVEQRTTKRTRRARALPKKLTILRLSAPLACPTGNRPPRPGKARERHLESRGKGAFETIGKYATARATGTVWRMLDRCDGTRVTVGSGVVEVLDIPRKVRLVVSAGETYLARPKR